MKFGKNLVSIYQPGSAAILNSIPGLEVIEGLAIALPTFSGKCESFNRTLN